MKADFSKIPTQELARMYAGTQTDLAMLANVAKGIDTYAQHLAEELKARAAAEGAPTQPAATTPS